MSENALALIENENAITYFNVKNGLDPIIEKIREEVSCIVIDISTKKGREECASLAHKIAKTKTAIDKRGKELVADMKSQVKLVDMERSRAWEELEKIQKTVRQPVTDWEDADKLRIATHERDIGIIVEHGERCKDHWQTISIEGMAAWLIEIQSDKSDWQEFKVRAQEAINQAITSISYAIDHRKKHDEEQAELARLRKEETERKQREHEEKLKAEAAEKAKKEAEAEAKKVADAEAARVKAEQEKAEKERLRLEAEKKAQTERAEKAERDRIAAEEKAKKDAEAAKIKADNDAKLAAEKAEKEKQAAVQAEKDRVAAEKKREADESAKREADKAHRTKINNEALKDIRPFIAGVGSPDDVGKAIIAAIAKGEVQHIRISY